MSRVAQFNARPHMAIEHVKCVRSRSICTVHVHQISNTSKHKYYINNYLTLIYNRRNDILDILSESKIYY